MTISVMAYGVVLGTLLVGSAHFMDRGIRAFALPTRWIWLTTMVGATLAPLLCLLVPSTPGPNPPAGAILPVEALYGLLEPQGSVRNSGVPFLSTLDEVLLVAWAGASLLVVLFFGGAALALKLRSDRWASRQTGGEEILVSDGVGPALLGFFNPRIVLPPWALSLEEDELRMVLLHEAEHRRARDPTVLMGGILLLALCPWNPALWWGLRRLRLAVEGDCDRRVLARGVPRNRYGRLLLGVASESHGIFPLAPALAEGGNSFLERRLRMMKTDVGRKRVGRALAAGVFGGLLLALACETPTPPAVVEEDGSESQASQVGKEAVSRFETAENEGVLIKVKEEGDGDAEASYSYNESVKFRLHGENEGSGETPLVYIDGVRMGSGKEALADLDPDEIERIEVIKGGAAAAMFGEEAASGVIQIFLKK
jgi:beta-lactamase regulating signal transducer with metallopeptidase domain